MTIQSSFIGPITDGVRRDSKDWSQPNDSFETLLNAYQFRDRLVKRSGYTLLGNLANGTPVMGLKTQENFNIDQQQLIAFDTTNSYLYNGSAFVPLPSVMPAVWSGTDHDFFFSTNYAGAFWATNSKPGLHGARISNVLPGAGITTITTSAPHGFTSGQSVTFINVGGIGGINGNTYVITVLTATTFTIPFMATGAYTIGGFVLNSSVSSAGQDGIRYYGILSNGTGWANYNPPINPMIALCGALMIFPYRGYLVFLNTTEGNETTNGIFNYGNRGRWIEFGTPYYSAPQPIFPQDQGVEPRAGRDDLFGFGGYQDAPTNEVIVGAEFVRDILIVYFERSTWRFRFVNNEQNPFVWERVHKELGSDCTFSTVVFDKGLMAIGNRGIVISDGNDTQRFDEKIPDDIFNIRQTQFGFNRVQGIKTFRTKLVYWTYPSSDNPTGIYPDKVLVFNYDTKNWSFFDDCFTCFGYYYQGGNNITWNDLTDSWSSTLVSWNSGISQDGYESVVAGNQQGFVFILETTNGQNSPSLNISSITNNVFSSTNHNLPDLSWVTLSGITTTTSVDGVSLNGRNFQVNNPDPSTFPSSFRLSEFAPVIGGTASGLTYNYTVNYKGIIAGSIQIDVGPIKFTDPALNGILQEVNALGSGTINYNTGKINLIFSGAIVPTLVNIRLVSKDPMQGLVSLITLNNSTNEGQIAKISGIDIQTKIFNFLQNDQRVRLSRIDFYVQTAANGQFTCNVWADSGNDAVNIPLSDNLFSNVVLMSNNPYQIGKGTDTIFRLYCDAICQMVQLQMTYSIEQMAVSAITNCDLEINAFHITMRQGGRLV